MRIRSRLLLLTLAVLVPGGLGAGVGLWHLYQEEQALHRSAMRETARALALVLQREIAERESVLRTLAHSPSLREGDLARFHRHARGVAEERNVALILSDTEGRQLLNTRLPFGAPLPRMLPEERAFRARHGNEATLVSNLYLPPSGLGPHSFAIQVPVRDAQGQVRQFLTMGSFARELSRLLQSQQLPQGWHASIVDRKGVVVARSREADRFVGHPVRPALRQALLTHPEGLHRGHSLSGVQGTAFFARAGSSEWSFLISVPDAALYGGARSTTALMAGLLLLLLALSLAASWLAARRIARPVERLRVAAQRLGSGEEVVPQPSGTEELDAVGEALAEASARMRRNTAELEERVGQALASYERSQRSLLQSQKLEALGRLTGGIAHDFNNVLQTLTAGLEAARRAPAQEQQRLLARCQQAVARGSELARQLMAFGRVQEVRTATIEPHRHLFKARTLFEGALPSNVVLDYDLTPGLWPVTVDPEQLELAVLNLVINARDAMPGGGTMVLRGSNRVLQEARGPLAPGAYIALALSDTGEGMPPEVVARAMDPFFTTKEVGQGSGMGLPQAYGFARQHGGTLELESEPGQGTTATLYLPRASQPLPLAPAAHAAPAGPGGRVLLVEDDALVRETVASALLAAGFEVHTACSADDALQRVEDGEHFDAVLTDVVMPGTLNGVELAQRLRERHPAIGVVIATGYTDRRVHVPGVRALPKPYDLQEAVEALREAMART